MIKRFEQYVNENLTSLVGRYKNNGGHRQEEGHYFKSCIGEPVHLMDKDADEMIPWILNGEEYGFQLILSKLSDANYSQEEVANVRNFEAPYNYLVYDGLHGTSILASFSSYDEVVDQDPDFEQRIIEQDYIELCRAIATKIKKVGNLLTHFHDMSCYDITSKRSDSSYQGYDSYMFELIDEADVNYWLAENEDRSEDYIQDFLYDFKLAFPEFTNRDSIWTWSFNNYANSLGMTLNYKTLMNIEKYREFTQKWFDVK